MCFVKQQLGYRSPIYAPVIPKSERGLFVHLPFVMQCNEIRIDRYLLYYQVDLLYSAKKYF